MERITQVRGTVELTFAIVLHLKELCFHFVSCPSALIRSWTEDLPVSSVLFLPLLLDMGQIGLEA